MARARSTRLSNSNSANIGFEQLWLAADKLRSNTYAAQCIDGMVGLCGYLFQSTQTNEL